MITNCTKTPAFNGTAVDSVDKTCPLFGYQSAKASAVPSAADQDIPQWNYTFAISNPIEAFNSDTSYEFSDAAVHGEVNCLQYISVLAVSG